MPYTDAVLHETQRVTNIFPLTAPRLTSRDSILAGYFIPKVLLLSCTVVALMKFAMVELLGLFSPSS